MNPINIEHNHSPRLKGEDVICKVQVASIREDKPGVIDIAPGIHSQDRRYIGNGALVLTIIRHLFFPMPLHFHIASRYSAYV